MSTQSKIFFFSLLVFFIPFLLPQIKSVNSLAIQSEDTVPSIFTTVAIIKDGTLNLDKYYKMMIEKYPHPDDKDYQRGLTPFYLKKVDSHYVTAFPIITSVLSIPVFAVPLILGMGLNWDNLALLGHLSGSIIVSLAGFFMFKILFEGLSLSKRKSTILTLVYLFATVNFAMLSQALWQHGTLQLLSILAVYFLLKYLRNPSNFLTIFLSGLFFGFAFLSRPTAGLPMLAFEIYLLYKNIKNIKQLLSMFVAFGAGLSIPLSFFFWYNSVFYHTIQNQGYSSQLINSWLSPFPISFLGVWLSPSKGILIFSPVLIFSVVGFIKAIKSKQNVSLNIVFASIVLVHTLVISLWKHWYGGWSFGYRMSSDVLPYFIFLMVPYINSELFDKTKKLFWALFTVSIFIEIYGLIFFDGIWHAAYDRGYDDTSWLWSIKDSEFIFDVRRILVKLGLLDRACPKCM